ncbi:MAG: hypothetical protein LQ351_004483 [Letrouitia transgressa]|nr:MAG: hypothetical protein LQ351_004483 [Letrouitia transgressa]
MEHSTFHSSSRSFLSRNLTKRDGSSESSEEVYGRLGLNMLHEPSYAIADLIFVHGLGGGSRSTWTKDNNSSLYWPQMWLPNDAAFLDVRIHSFGYNSNWEKESVLNIHDFAKSLLGSIQDCPRIPRDSTAPLIFVGHSMGGLVIKRAYILANQKEEFHSIARRVQAIFFLATPHRGADLAQLLTKILNLTSGARPFVADLHRNSLATQSINDEFPQYSQNLQLFSFYETITTGYGVGKSLIVDKDLATLGYPNERTAYLNANHRNVCKYQDETDPNYQTVRNTLASTIESYRSQNVSSRRELNAEQRRLLDSILNVSDAPEDDFLNVDALRMKGSCEWLTNKPEFLGWRDYSKTQLYWISAKPATGKTILSGMVVNHLRDMNRDCSFYFFNHGDRIKSNISSFLLSVAWQMSYIHTEVFQLILEICEKDEQINKADYRTIWRKIFLEGILRLKFGRPQYWIVDALDECSNGSHLVPLLLKAMEMSSLRIMVTCRDRFEGYRQLGQLQIGVEQDVIRMEDTKSDIALYLEANTGQLPYADEADREVMMATILNKSSGCFLWVRLILQELGRVHTSIEIKQVLEDIPSDMNELYARILESMSRAPYGRILAKAILVWTVCAFRPLTTEELLHALQLDIQDTIDSVERSILSSCSQLVYVDANSRVHMVHQTARDYLLQSNIISDFAVDRRRGHTRLAMVCLQYLGSSEMKGPKHRKLSAGNIMTERCPFVNYACNSFFEHMIHVSSTDDDFLAALAKFLGTSNVLSWIEYVARYSNLNRLIQAGKAFRSFFQRRAKSIVPLGKDIALLDAWAGDLVRLVTKFGKNLTTSPHVIFNLIPPFCPPDSAPRKHFAASARGITVVGLSAKTWDDCLSTIFDTSEIFSALACSEKHFGIGMMSGKIAIYDALTCQESRVLRHPEAVRILQFSEKRSLLASSGSKKLCMWDLTTGEEVWMIAIPQLCMSLAFMEADQVILGALKSNTLFLWDLTNGKIRDFTEWTQDLEGQRAHAFRRPIAASFCIESSLLAIVYRGQDILLWDLERDALFDTYSKYLGASPMIGQRPADAGAISLAFCRAPNANLLAASYSDGDLVLFDTAESIIRRIVSANAQILACSPDGCTLATGDGTGTIQLFDFETFKLLYRIRSAEDVIKQLAFSGDSHRLLDIRGSHCRVWDPVVLMRQDGEDEGSDTLSISTVPQEFKDESVDDVILITALVCPKNGDVLFCGKEDGSIYIYDIKTGRQLQRLFSHAEGVSIVRLVFDDESYTLTSVDSSSRVTILELLRQQRGFEVNKIILDYRVGIAIDQALQNRKHPLLLLCSVEKSMLWSTSAEEVSLIKDMAMETYGPYQWHPHPSNENWLILISKSIAYLFEWHTFKIISGPEGILLEGSLLPDLTIQSIACCFNENVIAMTFNESPRQRSKLLLWNAADFTPDAKTAAPVPKYHYLTDNVQLLIGAEGLRLVFLHTSGWVCSTDPQAAATESYSRHFFFPADWLITDTNLIIKTTQRGDVIFVKRDEIAIVRHALESIDRGPDSGNVGGFSVKRRSLTERLRSPERSVD